MKYDSKLNKKGKIVYCTRRTVKFNNLYNNHKQQKNTFRGKYNNINKIKLCHDTDKKLKTLLLTKTKLHKKIHMATKK